MHHVMRGQTGQNSNLQSLYNSHIHACLCSVGSFTCSTLENLPKFIFALINLLCYVLF